MSRVELCCVRAVRESVAVEDLQHMIKKNICEMIFEEVGVGKCFIYS